MCVFVLYLKLEFFNTTRTKGMEEHDWMYTGWSPAQPPSNDWIDNTNQFLDRAFSMPNLVEDGTIKCPCAVCRNCVRHNRLTEEMHLCRVGFKEDYKIWTAQEYITLIPICYGTPAGIESTL
jgi:hypothetical protein